MLWKIRPIELLALLVLATLTFLFHIQPVEARTIIVPDDYPTIQAAINAAATGDTVFVRNGTYYEHIEINRRARFLGTPKDLENLTIAEITQMSKTFPDGYPEPSEGVCDFLL